TTPAAPCASRIASVVRAATGAPSASPRATPSSVPRTRLRKSCCSRRPHTGPVVAPTQTSPDTVHTYDAQHRNRTGTAGSRHGSVAPPPGPRRVPCRWGVTRRPGRPGRPCARVGGRRGGAVDGVGEGDGDTGPGGEVHDVLDLDTVAAGGGLGAGADRVAAGLRGDRARPDREGAAGRVAGVDQPHAFTL